MVSLCSLKLITPTTMAKLLFTKCKRFFPDVPEHLFRNLLLVCSAITLARSTNLNLLKDYLPQLLANEHTKADSHYKRLIAPATRSLFSSAKAQSVSHRYPSIRFPAFSKPHYSSDLRCYYLASGTETYSFVDLMHPLPRYGYPHLLAPVTKEGP